eukprot:SAG25_NODE_3620_length_1021_cov_0.889371_1_plen_42_part_10
MLRHLRERGAEGAQRLDAGAEHLLTARLALGGALAPQMLQQR